MLCLEIAKNNLILFFHVFEIDVLLSNDVLLLEFSYYQRTLSSLIFLHTTNYSNDHP